MRCLLCLSTKSAHLTIIWSYLSAITWNRVLLQCQFFSLSPLRSWIYLKSSTRGNKKPLICSNVRCVQQNNSQQCVSGTLKVPVTLKTVVQFSVRPLNATWGEWNEANRSWHFSSASSVSTQRLQGYRAQRPHVVVQNPAFQQPLWQVEAWRSLPGCVTIVTKVL